MSNLVAPRGAFLDSLIVGLRCRCPRCRTGPLFEGYLKIRPCCAVCGLDFGFADPADGPAFFVMTAVSLIIGAAWTGWVIAAQPPAWLELVVVLPAMLIGCLGTLRPVKAWLVASQYLQKAQDIDFTRPNADGSFSTATSVRPRPAAEIPAPPPRD